MKEGAVVSLGIIMFLSELQSKPNIFIHRINEYNVKVSNNYYLGHVYSYIILPQIYGIIRRLNERNIDNPMKRESWKIYLVFHYISLTTIDS